MESSAGSEMYASYAEYMESQGIGIDSWDSLPEQDQNAWNNLAEDYYKEFEEVSHAG